MELVTAAGKAHLTYDEALEALGVTGKESAEELKRIFRDKIRTMHPDLPENRGRDTVQKALDLNAAYDILRGEAKPAAYDFRSPAPRPRPRDDEPSGVQPRGPRTQWEPPKPVRISFEEAKADAGIPASVAWQFVTDRLRDRGSYSGDESSLSRNAFVAYGLTNNGDGAVFVVAVHFTKRDMYVGGTDDTDAWFMATFEYPNVGDQKNNPAWLYKKVVEAFKFPHGEFAIQGRFNSKVLDARNWRFSEKPPAGREISIKHWLVNSGSVAGDAPTVVGRKQVVELEFSKGPQEPGYYPEPHGRSNFWDGKYHGDYWRFTLVLNGKYFVLGEADTTRILGARFGGDRLVNAIFGQYTYGSGKKNLTRLGKGKALLTWMAASLSGLPADAKAVLEAAAAQMKGSNP